MLDESKKALFSDKEWAMLETVAESGAKPVSATLAADMMNLYMENYSCAQIANLNKGFTELDILYCRYKYDWDAKRDQYAHQLQNMVIQKLAKLKLESVEFLTNQLAILHKEEREKVLRYLQTNNPEDKPSIWATNISSYKSLIEALQKITGEDKVQKHEVKAEHKIVASAELQGAITKEVQSSLLKQLATSKEKK